MAAYRLGYILLLLCGAVFSQVYAGHLSSVVFLSLLIMPVISLLLTLIQRFAFQLSFDGSLQKAERGDNLKFRITVLNRFVIPCSNVLITALMPGTLDKREARLIFSLCPFQKKNLYLTYGAEFRGEYECTLDKVFFYDYFKLFRIGKKLNITKKILIMPKLYDTDAAEPLSVSSDEESQVQLATALGSERSFIRKYADGDDVRKIHWKLSSKQEDYMIWQSAQSHTVENIIICDTGNVISIPRTQEPAEKKENGGSKNRINPPKKKENERRGNKTRPPVFGAADRTNALYSDGILETALAVAFYNIKNDRKTYISYFDGKEKKRTLLPAGSLEQIYTAVEIAAGIKTYSGKPEFADEAKSVFLNNSGKGAVLITHCRDMSIAKLAEELRALSEFALIIVGRPEENVRKYIENLSGVRFAVIDPENPSAEIPAAVKKIYKA
ncbi:MAG: DUF58 domain-containing protein [Firmicutes bacterium]|nr:DUF58 domain-containing protein [[Eubacterium] siraeum]MCM1487536.1 DUF58 domain-containing protein [Bacillota bacterium]